MEVIAIGIALPAAATEDILGFSAKQILMSVLAVLVSMVCVWIVVTDMTVIVFPVSLDNHVRPVSMTVPTGRDIKPTNAVKMALFVLMAYNRTPVCVLMALVDKTVNSSPSSVSQTPA